MTEPTPTPLERLRERLTARGEVRSGTVVGFDGDDVVVRLDDDPDVASARVPADGRGRVLLSAKACEDEPLRHFLLGVERGSVVTGTVTSVHSFGVFVRIDGESPHPVHDGTGFVRVPELSWSPIAHPAKVVRPRQRVTGEVLVADTRQGQVSLSLKALQEDLWDRLGAGAGDAVPGVVTKLVLFGTFVRVARHVEGLVHVDDLGGRAAAEGQELRVGIVEMDRPRRRVRLAPAD
ncbi:S1 RNA-binding domain-containing protein [Streptomyces puniciscabiei]